MIKIAQNVFGNCSRVFLCIRIMKTQLFLNPQNQIVFNLIVKTVCCRTQINRFHRKRNQFILLQKVEKLNWFSLNTCYALLFVLKHVLMRANEILLSNTQVSIYLQSHSLTLRQNLGQHLHFHLLALASSNT